METFHALQILALLTWILPVPFLFLSRRARVFFWLIISYSLSFTTEVTSVVLYQLKINPNYAGTVYIVISTIPISLFFYHAINSSRLRQPFTVFNVAFFVFAASNALFIQKLSPNYYTITLQNIFIIGACILYFYKLLNDLPVVNLFAHPVFIIVCGWFIGYCGKLVISVTGQYLYTILRDNMVVMWIIFNALTLLGNFAVTYGAYLEFRNSRATKSARLANVQ